MGHDVEGRSRGVVWGTVVEFVWSDWGNPWTPIWWPVFGPRYEFRSIENEVGKL